MITKYLIDTEFIRATKKRVHFLEISLLELDSGCLNDYHFDVSLNKWEQKYLKRGVEGYYGARAQRVFSVIKELHAKGFNPQMARAFCKSQQVDYSYKELDTVFKLSPFIENSKLYAWDLSNDIELIKTVKPRNVELVDVQVMWKNKFGGEQISLITAYKHVLYNRREKDEAHLIEMAHYSYCDVLLLQEVFTFIIEWGKS